MPLGALKIDLDVMAAFGFGYLTLMNNGNQFWSVQPYDPRMFGRSAF
jgi:hypothetical protein